MEVIIQSNRETACLLTARLIAKAARTKPNLVLGLATGSTIIVDEAAASRLQGLDYYRWIFDHEPEWQEYH